MTDNEIIKEATRAVNENLNASCYVGDLLRIIRLQRAEIEKWQSGYMTQKQEITSLEIELKAMRGAANSYKAEVKRLKVEKDNLIRTYAECRSEVIKEFAERLKQKETTAISCERFEGVVSTDDIDKLVKEMVGEKDDRT